MKLTPEQTIEAWRMRAAHMSWGRIGEHFGVCATTVRDTLYPERGEERNQTRQRLRRMRKPKVCHAVGREAARVISVPKDVWAERDARKLLEHTSTTAFLCGDPLPGRSALDRKNMGNHG